MRHGPSTSSRRCGTASRALVATAALLCACAARDAAPFATELAVGADDPNATPHCMIPRGDWRVRYDVSDPGTSCGLLLRDGVRDFDVAAQADEAGCTVKTDGPDEACRFHEVRRCTSWLGGSRYDSVVWRSFGVVAEDRLEGRGVASGGSSVLGLCQTTFTFAASPK